MQHLDKIGAAVLDTHAWIWISASALEAIAGLCLRFLSGKFRCWLKDVDWNSSLTWMFGLQQTLPRLWNWSQSLRQFASPVAACPHSIATPPTA